MTVRVRKARRSSVLACGCHVHRGQQIASRDHGPWTCLPCHLGAQDETFLAQLAHRTSGSQLKTVPPLDYDGPGERQARDRPDPPPTRQRPG
jgi:hypothetical protein